MCDDSLSSENLQFLTKEAKNKLGEEEFREYTKYACDELSDIRNESLQGFLDVIDIPKIKVLIEEKPRGGKYYLLCNRRSVIYRQEKLVKDKETESWELVWYDKPILDVPVELREIYLSQNEMRFYEVKIGDEDVCLDKENLLKFIQKERNYSYVSGRFLFDYISIMLRAYEKEKMLSEKQMYPAIGIFRDKDDDLKVVYPGVENITLFGENGYQKRTIKRCEELGIDIHGDLAEAYFNILHDEYYPESVRLGIAGHTITAPFYYILREVLDVFPNHHWIAPITGMGKTDFNELMYNYLYGIEMKSNDDVSSEARLSKMSTAHTMALYIDDIDDLPDDALSYMKFLATRFKPRERMDNQDINFENTYLTFAGSANSFEYLAGSENEGYRNRCLINTDFIELDAKKNPEIFEKNKDKIIHGKIFGYYVLEKVVEFINAQISDKKMSLYHKLRELFKLYKMNLREYLQEEYIMLVDSRRLTIYTLMYMGWKFWDYVFRSKGLKSEFFMKALDYGNNEVFLEFVRKYEGNLLQISIDQFINVIEYYKLYRNTYGGYYLTDVDDNLVLVPHFIHEFDKWAKMRGYEPLNSLTNLADMQMKILRENIKPKTIYLNEQGDLGKNRIYGLIFKLEIIKKLLNIEEDYSGDEKGVDIDKILGKDFSDPNQF